MSDGMGDIEPMGHTDPPRQPMSDEAFMRRLNRIVLLQWAVLVLVAWPLDWWRLLSVVLLSILFAGAGVRAGQIMERNGG